MILDMQFAWIPPGRFLMGGAEKDAQPQHRVHITKGFWMGIYPVTQKEFESVMGYNPSNFKGELRPVESVNWTEAIEFCELLTKLTEKAIRLPTEAEWEYAARAGTTTEFWSGAGESALKAIGWYKANANGLTHDVGEKKRPNSWGIHDALGNVWEYCADEWDGGFYGRSPEPDPLCGDPRGDTRVMRGGCWANDPEYCKVDRRSTVGRTTRDRGIGFRVCFTPAPADSGGK